MRVSNNIKFCNIEGIPKAYYELYVTNYSSDTIKIKQLAILNAANSDILISLNESELKGIISNSGTKADAAENIVSPGNTCIIYIELKNKKNSSIKNIIHRLKLSNFNKVNSEYSIYSNPAVVLSYPTVTIGAPLRNGIWTAVYHPAWERGHRRVFYTVNRKSRIPGRYAIDFVKVDSAGMFAYGNAGCIKSWLGYGEDVFAVADGIIASVRNDFSETMTISGLPDYSADSATGNYISLKIGDSLYAFYEHLKPNSIKVKPGQHVKKGDVIASLGFTGQTTGPHLHFHIADQDSPLGAEGLPFVFDSFNVLGEYLSLDDFGKTPWTPVRNSSPLLYNKSRPSPNAVIILPASKMSNYKKP